MVDYNLEYKVLRRTYAIRYLKVFLLILFFFSLIETVRVALHGAGHGKAASEFKRGVEFVNKGDYTRAEKSFRLAAKNGIHAATFNLGVIYYRKRTHQDYEKAFKWWRRAARQGLYEAETRIGVLYERGQGVEKDVAEAIRRYQKAAYRGDSFGQYLLGMSYLKGKGVAKNYSSAEEWLGKAAKQGNAYAQKELSLLDNQRLVDNDNDNDNAVVSAYWALQ